MAEHYQHIGLVQQFRNIFRAIGETRRSQTEAIIADQQITAPTDGNIEKGLKPIPSDRMEDREENPKNPPTPQALRYQTAAFHDAVRAHAPLYTAREADGLRKGQETMTPQPSTNPNSQPQVQNYSFEPQNSNRQTQTPESEIAKQEGEEGFALGDLVRGAYLQTPEQEDRIFGQEAVVTQKGQKAPPTVRAPKTTPSPRHEDATGQLTHSQRMGDFQPPTLPQSSPTQPGHNPWMLDVSEGETTTPLSSRDWHVPPGDSNPWMQFGEPSEPTISMSLRSWEVPPSEGPNTTHLVKTFTPPKTVPTTSEAAPTTPNSKRHRRMRLFPWLGSKY